MSKTQASILSFFGQGSATPPLPQQQQQQQLAGVTKPPRPPPLPASIPRAPPPPSASKYQSPPILSPPTSSSSPSSTTPATAFEQLLPAPNSSTPTSHPNAVIAPVTPEHIPALRRINSLLLPVAYPDAFYNRLLTHGALSRVILWSDAGASNQSSTAQAVGGIVCRHEPASPTTGPGAIYIQSLALLSPYRSLGLAAAALDEILRSVEASLPSIREKAGAAGAAESIYAHVWTENEEGLDWYTSRGFTKSTAPVSGYYFKLRPNTAWVVRKPLGGQGVDSLGGLKDGNLTPTATEAQQTSGLPRKTSPAGPSVTAAALNALPASVSSLQIPSGPAPPGPPKAGLRPPLSRSSTSQSFQNQRPETEWNDMPAEMLMTNGSAGGAQAASTSAGARVSNMLEPPGGAEGNVAGSAASSRSSSAVGRKKRDRAYPAAAFGS